MFRSNLPVSLADRVAATFTLATIVALMWLIAAAPQESHGAAFAEPAVPARHVDESCDVAAPVAADHVPVQFKAPKNVATEHFARS